LLGPASWPFAENRDVAIERKVERSYGFFSRPSQGGRAAFVAISRWEATASNPALHHINLKTTSLAEMIEWHGKVAGMTVSH
jgi:hypothetical protein